MCPQLREARLSRTRQRWRDSVAPQLSFTQPSSTADVAPQDTHDPSAAFPLPQTKPGVHAFSQKTYVANQNNTCPKAAQEDIADSSISNTPESYRAHRVSHPNFHRAKTNSTLS
jgi:hypothetical protein